MVIVLTDPDGFDEVNRIRASQHRGEILHQSGVLLQRHRSQWRASSRRRRAPPSDPQGAEETDFFVLPTSLFGVFFDDGRRFWKVEMRELGAGGVRFGSPSLRKEGTNGSEFDSSAGFDLQAPVFVVFENDRTTGMADDENGGQVQADNGPEDDVKATRLARQGPRERADRATRRNGRTRDWRRGATFC